MKIKVAFQMDALETLNFERDTTVALIFEALRRGFECYFYHPQSLAWEEGLLKAKLSAIQANKGSQIPLKLGTARVQALKDMTLIWMRQDPPFNMGYITASHLLERLPSSTLVVNDPSGVRNAPEKLLVTQFAHLMPPTLITQDLSALQAFFKRHQDIVLKPLFDYGGHHIIRVHKGQPELEEAIQQLKALYPEEPLMGQLFLPEVLTKGDKRILLLEGKPIGAFVRLPQEGKFLANTAQGGKVEKTTLMKQDQKICETIGPILKEKGLLFAGIDVIGGYLTEINVTSPTGIPLLNQLYHISAETQIWDAVLTRRLSLAFI